MGQLFEITPFSLLDYPGEMACIAWFAGCNMRCVYCHNPQIVQGKGEKDIQELFDFLERRTGRLSAVVFSGGEATLYPELSALIQRVKAMGFKTKLDTNGSRPEVLQEILAQGSVDYIAMDYKCPREMAQSLIGTAKFWEPFKQSLAMMIEEAARNPSLTFEVRTTVYADKMSEQELNWIINDLDQMGYKGTYFVQNVFSFGEKTIGNISEPECEISHSRLITPQNFTLGFRNFKE